MLDAVVTVVDAKHAMSQLDQQEEAQRQVGFAYKLLLSNIDLVDAAKVAALTMRLKRINPRAPIITLDPQHTPIDGILDIRGFNLNAKLEIDLDFLATKEHRHDHSGDDCNHPSHRHYGQPHNHHHAHHDDEIAAFVFKSERPFDTARLDEFLGGLVQVYGPPMLRYKSVLLMDGADRKVVFQGVHQIMGSDVGGK